MGLGPPRECMCDSSDLLQVHPLRPQPFLSCSFCREAYDNLTRLKLSRSASRSCKWYLEQKCTPRDVLGCCRICCPALVGDAGEKLPPEAEVGMFWRGEEWFRLQAFLEQRCELLHTQPRPDGCSSEPWCPGKGGCVLMPRAVRSSCSSPGCSRHLTLARLFLLPPCS